MIGATFSQAHYDLYKETGDKNLFEEVLDKLVMDEHLDLDQDVKDYIMSDDIREDKRIFILSNLLKEKSLEIVNSFTKLRDCDTRAQHLNEALLTLNKYIEVGQQEVKKYGEVFTPLSLVKEMVSTLPKEVWSNPNLKWLDPANGMGNFPLIVIYKLMKGLESWEPNVEKRYRHIIENMIYACELQPRNAFMYLSLVDPKDDLSVNLYCGSFLDEGFDYHMKNIWSIEKFDIVIGNPPYQEMVTETGKSKGGGKGGDNNLWSKFVSKSLIFCDYLLFIHPPSFLSPNHKILKSFLSCGGLRHLHIYEKSPFEGIGTHACYYLFEKNYKGQTNTQSGLIDLENEILPNSSNAIDFKIFSKFFNNKHQKMSFVSNSKLHRTTKKDLLSNVPDDTFKYKVYHASSIVWSKVKTENYHVKKVIVSDSGYLSPKYDFDCSTTQHSFFTEVDDERNADFLISLLNSKLYRYCMTKSKFSGFFHGNVLKNIPVIPDNLYTDDQLFEYFNFSEEEINLINS